MIKNKQTGITLIGAIFVVVIVSLLGIYLVKITGVQRENVVMNLQSARAYQAANAGIEWGLSRLINASSCVASNTLSTKPNNFTVTVECSKLNASAYNEAGTTTNIYQITATSEYGSYASSTYSSRTIQTLVHD